MIPIITVVYVNYNTTQLLIDSIRSLRENCTNIIYEIIIVDNASYTEQKNALYSWVNNNTNIKVNLILSDKNLGFGKANNLAAKSSSGKYLFFLNPDTLIINNVLEIFYNFLESANPNAAACGGNLLKPNKEPNDSYGNFPGILQEMGNTGLGLSVLIGKFYKQNIAIASHVHSNRVFKVPYIVGADLFIKSEIFKLVGGFDENFFMYYEETDLFKRLNKEGFESYILPEAKIVHFEGGAIGANEKEFNYKKFEMLLRSKRYYYTKWSSSYSMLFLKTIFKGQIIVQYYKGKMGKDLKRLFTIYRQTFE